MDFVRLIEWLKLPTTYFVAFLFASCMILFGGDALVDALGLAAFRDTYRPWIGLVLLISAAMLFARFTAPLAEKLGVRTRRAITIRRKLNHLSTAERELLDSYVNDNTRSKLLGAGYAASYRGLITAGILERAEDHDPRWLEGEYLYCLTDQAADIMSTRGPWASRDA